MTASTDRVVIALPLVELQGGELLRWIGRQLENQGQPNTAMHLYAIAGQIEDHFKEAS